MKDQAVKEKFVELRAMAWSFDRIAKELHVSKQTLVTWSRDFALEIQNRRAIEYEALLEQHALTREKKVEALGLIFKRMREELETRSFTTIPTQKLLEGILKLIGEVKGIDGELTFRVRENLMESLNTGLDTTVSHWSS